MTLFSDRELDAHVAGEEDLVLLGARDAPGSNLPPAYQRMAERLALAQYQAERYRLALERFKSRRSIRLATLLAEVARRPSTLLRLPARLPEVFRRRPPPALPERPDPGEALVAPGAAPPSGRFAAPRRLRYPHLVVGHLGATRTFGAVAPHASLEKEGWEEHLDWGLDLLLLEPAPGQDAPGGRWAALERARAGGVPVVLAAREQRHVDLARELKADLVVCEDRRLTESAVRDLGADAVLHLPPSVDPSFFNPIGWERDPQGGIVAFSTPAARPAGPDRTLLEDGDPPLTLLRLGGDPEAPSVSTAAELAEAAIGHAAALVAPSLHHSEAAATRLALSLLATGVPVISPGMPGVSELIPSDLILHADRPERLAAQVSELASDPEERERLSIRGRRAVLRDHTRGHRFDALLEHLGLPVAEPESVSVILSTNRPHLVEQAVSQVSAQTFPRTELVLALHGDGFEPGLADRLRSSSFPTRVVEGSPHWTFGECLNAAVDLAGGSLVAKMDDDDFYGPEYLWDLVLAMEYSGADLVGKWADWVYLAHRDVTVFRETRSTERPKQHVAGPTLMVRRETARRYRFRRRNSAVDMSFYRRILQDGGSIYITHPFDFVLHRRSDGHTWDADDRHFLAGARRVHRGLALSEAFTA